MTLLRKTFLNNSPLNLGRLRTVVTALLFFCLASTASGFDSPDPALASALKKAAAAADSFDNAYDAEVWLVSKDPSLATLIKDKKTRLDLLRLIHKEASRAGLQPEIVLALIEVESHFNQYAVSSAGAQGMMQVMPFWKKEIGRPDDNLIHTQTNLRYGCTILKYYLDREKGRLADALARYNGSYGQYWYAERVLNAWTKNWK